jgi:hypothetical protein
MAINTESKTITPATGAGSALKTNTAQQYTSTVGGKPVAQATPTTATPQPTSPEPVAETVAPPITGVRGPIPEESYYVPEDASDVNQLARVRSQMINELFNHENNLKQQFTNPNIADPLLREQLAYQPQETQLGLLSSLNNLISMRKNELKAATKAMSPTEKKQFYLEQLQNEISQGGGEFKDYVKAYKAYLPVNEIVEMYNTSNPDKPVDLKQAQAYGYKAPAPLVKSGNDYSDAVIGLDAVDKLEASAKQANKWYSDIYMIMPKVLTDRLGSKDPVAGFQTSRMAYAQEMTKRIMGSNYPGVAKNILDLIPTAYDNDDIRDGKITQLKGMLTGKMDEAERNAQGFALGNYKTNYAQRQQPVATVQNPITVQPTQLTTKSGKTYVVQSAPNTAMNAGGL